MFRCRLKFKRCNKIFCYFVTLNALSSKESHSSSFKRNWFTFRGRNSVKIVLTSFWNKWYSIRKDYAPRARKVHLTVLPPLKLYSFSFTFYAFIRTLVLIFNRTGRIYYEIIPIQIYWKFYHPKKMKKNQIKNSDIFHISAKKHKLWILVRTSSTRRFERVHTICVLSRNKKNNVYPCKPQFYFIKLGLKGVNII